MKTTDFVKLVAQMREQQSRYFKSDPHSADKRDALIKSKDLEKQVDQYVKYFQQTGSFENPQPELF